MVQNLEEELKDNLAKAGGIQCESASFLVTPELLEEPASGRKRRYRRIIGTVDACRTAGGLSSDDRRTVVGGARVVSGAEKKNHLIEAAPFGRLDQM